MRCCLRLGSAEAFAVSSALSAIPSPVKAQDSSQLRRITSDVPGDGFIGNGWFNSQSVNPLATLKVTPDDRCTVKLINDVLSTWLPVGLSLNQFNRDSFQAGCDPAGEFGSGIVSLDARNRSIVAILRREPDRVLWSDGARELLAARAGPKTQARAPPQPP